MLPNFDVDGFLPPGVHNCTGKEFLARFTGTKRRQDYTKPIMNVLDYAAHHGALAVLIGGSFVTSKPEPRDLDCVILFERQSQIPSRIESLDIEGDSFDIFFASRDQPNLVASFVKLLSTSRFQDSIGVVEIRLRTSNQVLWDVTWEPDEEAFEIVRAIYLNRHIVEKIPRRKTLVTIHGIRTYADWNAEVTLCASSNGWTVAPFQYGYLEVTALSSEKKRQEILDSFRDFLAEIDQTYGVENVSVIAHSFGTYIACRYILGFDVPPVRFDTLILSGAIVNEKLDLNRFEGKIANIVNERAPNDEWVEWSKIGSLFTDDLFGYAGTRGFANPTSRLDERSSEIFKHNNVIRRDVVTQRWLPTLEANCGSVYREAMTLFSNEKG